MNNKPFVNFLYIFSIISVFTYMFLSMPYNVDEFNRPFLYLYGPVTCFCIFFMLIFFRTSNLRKIRDLFLWGVALGMSLGITATCINYTLKKPVIVSYELINVSQGKNAVIYEILTDTGEQIPLTIATSNWHLLDSTGNIFLYKGILGFYFGNIEFLKNKKIPTP